jgi:iron(III) transport system permease protein
MALRRMALGVALLLLASPLVALVVAGIAELSAAQLWHLAHTVLPMQFCYSLAAAIGAPVVAVVLALGGASCALFDFPGRAILQRLLLLPLLVPAWFLAALYREQGLGGGLLALVLIAGVSAAPWFHLFIGAALRSLPSRYLETLRLVGRTSPRGLLGAAGMAALPAAVAAAALVFLQAWSDVASAQIMAVPTLAVGLLDHWFGLEQPGTAVLAAIALFAVSLVPALLLWRLLTRTAGQWSGRVMGETRRLPLAGWRAAVPWLLAAPQLALGVLGPGLIIGAWTLERLPRVDLRLIGSDLVTTVMIALSATLLAALLALPLVHAHALSRARAAVAVTSRLSFACLALPPLALGLAVLRLLPGGSPPGWAAAVNATLVPVVLALGLRYCAVFVAAAQATLLGRGRQHCELMRSCERVSLFSFARLLRAFLARPVAAAATIVFIEASKDLPLSLLLGPFDVTTVAMRLFQYAQTQRLKECAVWVLCLALVGIYPLFALARLTGATAKERVS